MKISIAMATYNGERYVLEQLQSLARQLYKPHELVICDDGSTDATLSIVETFSRTAPFLVRIYRNESNLGYSDNFLQAARLCSGDWVAFCDQDDVWLPNKLKDAAEAIARHPGLTMILQNAELCDDRLCRSGRIFPGKIKPAVYGALSQYGFWVWPGFLKTVRSEIFVRIDSSMRPLNYFPDNARQSHDKWTCMMANALGGICILDEPAALYRRHEAALTGSYSGKSISERVSQSRTVESNHYRFLGEVAKSSSSYLEKEAAGLADEEWRHSLVRSAACFHRLADIQGNRESLYEADSILARASCYFCIWRSGGYIGPRFTSMGWKSAVKDAARVVAGSWISAGASR